MKRLLEAGEKVQAGDYHMSRNMRGEYFVAKISEKNLKRGLEGRVITVPGALIFREINDV